MLKRLMLIVATVLFFSTVNVYSLSNDYTVTLGNDVYSIEFYPGPFSPGISGTCNIFLNGVSVMSSTFMEMDNVVKIAGFASFYHDTTNDCLVLINGQLIKLKSTITSNGTGL